ncbi:MAG: hypothetical protein ACHQQQ_10930 [Bacteroidota bacterium]
MNYKKGTKENMLRSMRVLIAIIFCSGIFVPINHLHAQEPTAMRNLVQFYSYADTVALFAPSEDSLRIIKQKVVDKFYVAFIGFKKSPKVRIVAVTPKPIKDVRKDIALTVQFAGYYPRAGRVTSWGWIWDRNGDGKIDYLALLGGAAPVERGDMPEDYPPRGVQMNADQIEFMVGHCRLIFNYWADDNFDGKLDGLIHFDLDPVRDWVQDQIVIRSTKFNTKFDEVWAFQDKMANRADTVSYSNNRVPYHPIGKPIDEITEQTFKDKTDILNLINRAARIAGLSADDFVSGNEGKEQQ